MSNIYRYLSIHHYDILLKQRLSYHPLLLNWNTVKQLQHIKLQYTYRVYWFQIVLEISYLSREYWTLILVTYKLAMTKVGIKCPLVYSIKIDNVVFDCVPIVKWYSEVVITLHFSYASPVTQWHKQEQHLNTFDMENTDEKHAQFEGSHVTVW